MNHFHSSTRLRRLTSILSLVICTLVLVWGSAFKASLYHTCRDLAHVPTAKFLSEHERPDASDVASVSRPQLPRAPRTSCPAPAFPLTAPRRSLLPAQSPRPSWPASNLSTQDAAHGIYFHRPPPIF